MWFAQVSQDTVDTLILLCLRGMALSHLMDILRVGVLS